MATAKLQPSFERERVATKVATTFLLRALIYSKHTRAHTVATRPTERALLSRSLVATRAFFLRATFSESVAYSASVFFSGRHATTSRHSLLLLAA